MFVYKVLHIITHTLLITIDLIYTSWIFLKMHFTSFMHRPQRKGQYDVKRQSTLHKVPKHLGIVITEDFTALSDLANVIFWCVTAGIPHLSVYDYNGKLITCI